MTGRSVSFRVDMGLLRELGERLISRDEVAVVELVKNAYDADATAVKVCINEDRIEVTDNGTGMDEKQIQEGWLTIGTALKKRESRTEKGRRVLGEKGLGRLAVLRLGRFITIHTRKRGKACYTIVMDWDTAKRKLAKNQYTPIEELSIRVSARDEGLFAKRSGTSVVIERLNAEWTEKSIDRLRVFLSRLVEPDVLGRDRFEIMLYWKGEAEKVEPPEVTKKPHYRLEVAVDDDGTYSGTLRWDIENSHGEEEIEEGKFTKLLGPDGETRSWKEVSAGGCGAFKFRLNVWDLDARELRGHKQALKEWAGISLLRDGFRVVQPDIDWLGLDLRRVQVPTLRLSTNQIIGSVIISSDQNPQLIDKTDREGIVENEAAVIMKSAVYALMNILERKRHKLRRRKGLSRGIIFKYLDTAPLRQLAKQLPPRQRRGIEEYASNIDRFKDMLEEWILGRDRMATMGLLAARLMHEVRGALAKITDSYPLVEKHLGELVSPLRERIERMVAGGRTLDSVFNELNPFLKFKGKRRQEIVLRGVVDALEFLFGPELKKNQIELRNRVARSLRFRANRTDMYVMLANFLDNAVYWLSNSDVDSRIVEVRGREASGQVVVQIADSGPGVPLDEAEHIFDAGYTTKPGGTGLGLSIVRDVVEFYGGRVEVAEDDDLGGARFKVTLPLKGG